MPVTLINRLAASVKLADRAVTLEQRRPSAQSHRAAHLARVMFRHVDDQRVLRVCLHLHRISVGEAEDVPSKLNDGSLQSQANSQKRFFVLAGPTAGADLPLNPTLTETARNQNAAENFSIISSLLRNSMDLLAHAQTLPCLVVQNGIFLLHRRLQVASFDELEIQLVADLNRRVLQRLRH